MSNIPYHLAAIWIPFSYRLQLYHPCHLGDYFGVGYQIHGALKQVADA